MKMRTMNKLTSLLICHKLDQEEVKVILWIKYRKLEFKWTTMLYPTQFVLWLCTFYFRSFYLSQ